ncbi:hypothetical protein NQ314_013297 [Rhamnusium bicolor]|uniref:Uncharacterized protein n=1 Tax=Rhamnusium bicolor TaxID=1586634 RepID=A0AAV8X946_9CUCU|nr:hypothetical protein NQ314_013297 [Rhamnusium bicolor]
MCSLKFNMYKNNDNIKNITLETNTGNWKEYRSKLSSFKISINEYLTELVELDKVADTGIEIDEDSENSEDEKGSKRALFPISPFEKSKIPKI